MVRRFQLHGLTTTFDIVIMSLPRGLMGINYAAFESM